MFVLYQNLTAFNIKSYNMNLSSRQAELKDVEWIAELSGQLGYKTSTKKIESRLSGILNNDNHCIYVALDNESIIGWIHGVYSLRVESDAFVEIGGLVVHENYRRKGVGKMLVKQVTEWTRAKGTSNIRVRCNTMRKEAHAFYNRIGFSETKEQKIFDMTFNNTETR